MLQRGLIRIAFGWVLIAGVVACGDDANGNKSGDSGTSHADAGPGAAGTSSHAGSGGSGGSGGKGGTGGTHAGAGGSGGTHAGSGGSGGSAGTHAAPDSGTSHEDSGVEDAGPDGAAADGGADAGVDGGADAGMDAAQPMNLALGADCTTDISCVSQLCKPVVIGHSAVCVTSCTAQTDCGSNSDYFCEPISAGSVNGYCVPHSATACLACDSDADCGSLSEVCFQAPGDNAKACHADCAIADAEACPADYSCTDQLVAGDARRLCRPNVIPTCADAVGGYCDRVTAAQPCERTNSAGMCTGQRTCSSTSHRFDKCDAVSPACRTDCSVQEPAGCTEMACSGATTTVTNCGGCGTICPGYQKPNDNVTCNGSMMCTFGCQGENYDVNKDPTDGCESTDSTTGNHSKVNAANQGSVSDCDTAFTINGKLISDNRSHQNPNVSGYDPVSGSAADWYVVLGAAGGFCQNDLVLQLAVQSSSMPTCYKLIVMSDKVTLQCQTDATGSCSFSNTGGGQFTDNTNIYLEVQKTCATNVLENVSYAISGHL